MIHRYIIIYQQISMRLKFLYRYFSISLFSKYLSIVQVKLILREESIFIYIIYVICVKISSLIIA